MPEWAWGGIIWPTANGRSKDAEGIGEGILSGKARIFGDLMVTAQAAKLRR